MNKNLDYADIVADQKITCSKYQVPWVESPLNLRVGIMKNLKSGTMPLNGLRHEPENGTAGWYLWAGEEWTTDVEFWDSVHLTHLEDFPPQLLKFLGLPPGYRFLTDGNGYEDVWEDKSLISNIKE